MLMTWLLGPLLNTPPQPHVRQETINRVWSRANEWCMDVNCSETQATLFSLSTVKRKVMLKLKNMPVPQVDNPTFLGVTLDKHLTWKTHLEAVAARSMRKLGLLRNWPAKPEELTQTSCEGSIQEQSIPSWRVPQPPGPQLQMPT